MLALAGALLSGGALTGGAAPAQALPTTAPADFLGSNAQSLFRLGDKRLSDWPKFLNQVSNAGLGVTRFDASWALAEPVAPGTDGVHHYTWDYLDRVATALARAHQRWLPVVDLPPQWAHNAANSLPDSAIPSFVAFATAFAQRYGNNGAFWATHPQLPHLPITQVEVWTEANSSHFWNGGAPDPHHYLSVFTQIRGALKAVDPSMQVLVSLGWQDFWNFMTVMYDAGLAGQSDGIGFHPYAPTPGGIVKMTRTLRTLLGRRGEPDLPIYITEIGQPVPAPGIAPAASAYAGAIADGSRAASAAIAADALAHSDCNVKGYDWYSLVEPQLDPANVEDWLGLVNVDGSTTQTLLALGGSARRWSGAWGMLLRGGRRPMMDLCRGRDARDIVRGDRIRNVTRLPLQLHVPMPAPSPCMTISTTYYGNPLEDVSVFVRNDKGRTAGKVTTADGLAPICVSTGAPKRPFLAWARSGGFAASPLLWCKGARCLGVSCNQITLSAKVLHRRADRLRLRLSTKCGTRVLAGEPVRVTGVAQGGRKIHLAGIITGSTTKVYAMRWRARWRLKYLRVQFRGDKAFLFRSRVVYRHLPADYDVPKDYKP